jgi:enoyl-CoA hydratase
LIQEVIVSQRAHIGILTLNRPNALNALSLPMILSIQNQLFAWQDDPNVHAVVVNAEGGKAFCAGGDVRSLFEERAKPLPEKLYFFQEEYRLNQLIYHYSKPYIALMDGITMGGGVGISLHGSHPVASERFVFAMPETSIGFFPDIGASYFLSRCRSNIGIYLGLTGNRINASESHALGLVKHVIDASKFSDMLKALQHTDLSSNAKARVSACLQTFSEQVEPDSILTLEARVKACFSLPKITAIFDSLSQSPDTWHQNVLSTLKQKSPLSLCVTLAQLQRASHLSFEECIQMDFTLVQHFLSGHDFYEGVRALLVDKDKCPQWQDGSVAEVTAPSVETYFNSVIGMNLITD